MSNIIKDCIYGFISVPKLCHSFMDTYMFQRLRTIKQLGLVYMVYPGAVHTRLEHSLGVMYLAGEVVKILKETGCDITAREKELVQLAGLYHDVGHMAFSHLLDHILVDSDKHEQRSITALKEVNSKLNLLTEAEEEMVSAMIMGEVKDEKPYLYEIIHNSRCGLDVDRFDYLQRDAYHTGIPGFQSDYLINCIRANKQGNICFKQKARNEVESLYEARKRMFSNVYRHKTVLAIEELIRKIMNELGIINKVSKTISDTICEINNSDSSIINWWTLDDVELLHLLRQSEQFSQIYNRSWERSVLNTNFENCSDISRDEIKDTMNKVLFL
jgi:uncharacterized protein